MANTAATLDPTGVIVTSDQGAERTCSLETCDRTVRGRTTRGLCKTHERRLYRGIPLDQPVRSTPGAGKSASATEWLCRDCEQLRSAPEFHRRADGRVVESVCRQCRAWRDVERRYGIDRSTWVAIFEAQNGACALCKEPFDADTPSRNIVVDHDHVTGEVRGLLDHACNLALGWLEAKSSLTWDAICRYRNLEGTWHLA